MNTTVRKFAVGAAVGGSVALFMVLFIVAVLFAPLVFWLAWNVLDLGPSMGLPELGFWAIVLAAVFLVVGWFGKGLITAIVFLADPGWLSGAATITWPEATFRNFLAILLLAALASRPHSRAGNAKSAQKRSTPVEEADGPWKAVAVEVRDAVTTAIDEERHRREPGA